MPFSTLVYFYARRLRAHPVQELLAGLGIAVGVALIFSVQVANNSVTGGSSQVVQSITAGADLQLRALGPAGLPESIADRARRLPGVKLAGPVLSLTGSVRAESGRSAVVQFASADASLPLIAGLARNLEQSHLTPANQELPGILLPRATARKLGIELSPTAGLSRPAPIVTLLIRGRAVRANVIAVLGSEDVGPLAGALAAILDLEALQRIAGMPKKISSVLVQEQPGRRAQVLEELHRLARRTASVVPADQDVALLRQATVPSDRATGFFAFVSGLVGLLLAFGAMLMSIPERRRMVADLRIQGTGPWALAELLLFQALCLGVVASLVGVGLGDVLSRSVFHQTPGYLALAFPLGTDTVIGWEPVVLSLLGGVLATCLAALPPLLDLRTSRAVDAVYFDGGEPGQALKLRTRVSMFAAALCFLALSILLPLLLGASAAVAAIVALAFATVCAIPLAFTGILHAAEWAAGRLPATNMLLVATRTLRATTARSLALAATGAIAVYGTVAANGAHKDLLRGLYRDYTAYVSSAPLWVAGPKDYLATSSFPTEGIPERLRQVPGVAAVREYRGGFVDAFGRRLWLIARSPAAPRLLPAGQVLAGRRATAERLLRSGGWIAISQQLAREQHVGVGGRLTVPSPTGPAAFRIAALTTNLGWAPGALVMSAGDFVKDWAASDPTALELDLSASAEPAAVRSRVQATLGAGSSLVAQSSSARAEEADALAREGLSRLSQIALLLTAAAVLAMTAAIGASIWQRRPALASLRIQSFRPAQLRLILLWEAGLVVASGAVLGAAAGIYGHALIDLYLRSITGFPTVFSPAPLSGLIAIAGIVGATLLLLAGPGLIASRVPPGAALQEQG